MIAFDNVSFRYAFEQAPAIAGVCFRAERGQFILLTGRSGCGKTTVTRLLNGLAPGFYDGELAGDILINGQSIKGWPLHEISAYAGSVFQDPRSQFFTTDTTSEIAFACENAGLPRAEIIHRISSAIDDLQIRQLADRDIFTLSSGEKQVIAIASVYAYGPPIFILDEPSANLDKEATEKLRQILVLLKAKGYTVIISEHRLYYLRELVDKAILLENGAVAQEMDREAFLRLTNKDAEQLGLRCLFPGEPGVPICGAAASGQQALAVTDLSFRYPRRAGNTLERISFSVDYGEIIGITGPNGAGKTTLMEIICGLKKEKSGQLLLGGTPAKPRQRIKSCYYVMQDCDYQLFTESVVQELLLGSDESQAVREKARRLMDALDLTAVEGRHPASLSGGQKQRVSIAAACMRDAGIICFDEPTSGLDLWNMRRTAALMKELAQMGKAVIVISHDDELLSSVCTRIIRVEKGGVAEGSLHWQPPRPAKEAVFEA